MQQGIPPHFVQMKPEQREKLLADSQDILTEESRKEIAFLYNQECPNCGTNPCNPILDTSNIFGGGLLPKKLLKCLNCEIVFEPHTRIQVTQGKMPKDAEQLAKMFVDDPID